jgi:hypothetical protein
MTIGPRQRSPTMQGHPQSPFGLLQTPLHLVSSGWTRILSFRTFSTLNVPNALSNKIPGRGTVRTNQFGIASLDIRRNAVILVHNTDKYVNCADERHGLIHNDFQVSQILSTGLVQAIEQPNLCGKASGVPKPGELILFVRPWRLGEKI